MQDRFVELKTTESQTVYVRKSEVGAFEVIPATSHVEGHIKLYISGYKFLVEITKEELLKQLTQ